VELLIIFNNEEIEESYLKLVKAGGEWKIAVARGVIRPKKESVAA